MQPLPQLLEIGDQTNHNNLIDFCESCFNWIVPDSDTERTKETKERIPFQPLTHIFSFLSV